MTNKFSEKGQSILEVMIALAAATIIITAIVAAVISALSNEQFSIGQNQATQFAQEGLDSMRNLSQTDWNTFVNYPQYNCLGKNETIPTQRSGTICPENMDTGSFIREIWIESNSCTSPTPPSLLNTKVTSVVKWADGKCMGAGDEQYCHKVELISCYFRP